MIEIKDRVRNSALQAKITTAEAAAALIKPGMNIGASGFTPAGYPKAVPLALAERMKASPFYDRVVDVMEELVKFTVLLRDQQAHLVDRYSERKESSEHLMARVNQRSI